ncbi:methylenetetrahydrofolate reductase [Ornithinimicrobium cerasi]|uniref:Methylenetetrahydrofolate reductase n=1 Tax=Ornithinimicrobium cerasi TaxID=2248773 RepID=A0A285VSK7_9MICO|nr:methylenetetrahydrofolate reductase [Ornithinimicrobium cerasi]SOC57035.1 methylenetetrahydrofolate reductase (NADPH) [Ornithinimicrobium cerasi]
MTGPQTRISVELVPRSAESLAAEVGDIASRLPWVSTINVPDLLKFELRSWDACGLLRALPARPDGRAYPAIPHVRAADVDPDAPLPMAEAIVEHGVEEVLVVSGDDADYFTHHTYPVDAVDVIRRFRAELPHVKVYAGLDPYRNGIAAEMRYLERKLSAGAAGVFTQPFFDTSYLRAWSALLPEDLEVWWGATTVTTPASVGYWRRRNMVAFPRDFELTLQWQRDLARRVIDVAQEQGQHVYLMPVRTSVLDYLDGVL